LKEREESQKRWKAEDLCTVVGFVLPDMTVKTFIRKNGIHKAIRRLIAKKNVRSEVFTAINIPVMVSGYGTVS
jgi:hypothetical protein